MLAPNTLHVIIPAKDRIYSLQHIRRDVNGLRLEGNHVPSSPVLPWRNLRTIAKNGRRESATTARLVVRHSVPYEIGNPP